MTDKEREDRQIALQLAATGNHPNAESLVAAAEKILKFLRGEASAESR